MMSDKLDMIYEAVQELQQITRAIQNRQEETDAKLESLTLNIAHMQGDMTRMQEDMTRMQGDMAEMKEELVSVKGLVKNHDALLEQLLKSQVRQEKILERLSIRSIEQESEIFTLRGLYQ